MKNTFPHIVGALLLLAFAFSCSVENKSLPGRIYHNTTARFNAYWIANYQLKEIQQEIQNNHQPNYDRILKIHPEVDSAIIEKNKAKLSNIIKMSSIAIQRHKHSKWVDDCYILVGQARYLMGEFPEAIETFKYVNVNGKNDHKKHRSLIQLIRAFTDAGEYNNAQAVVDYLRRQKLNRANKLNYHIQTAYLHQTTGNIDFVLKSLTEASKYAKKNEGLARINFIIGQIYQALDYDAVAYDYYKDCLKNKPEYELYFYASLYMAQVTELNNPDDEKSVRKYFEKLLKDGKNKDYKDKIYYELAEFEYKRDEIQDAIEAYKSSVRYSTNNDRQKAYSYWKLGKIHFEELKSYDLSKAYYDSTVMFMPKNEEVYEKIAARQAVLSEFIQQIVTIETQDSLLRLAQLDSLSINKIFEDERNDRIIKDKEKQRQEKRRQARAAQAQSSGFGGPSDTFGSSGLGDGSWYFYNAAQVANGQTAFIQKWGNRKLEDNWRRANKQMSFEEEQGQTDSANQLVQEEINISEEDIINRERTEFFATIPFSEEEQELAHRKIETALYILGNIYNFDLLEKSNAAETYTTLLERYPETENRVEVMYLLYLYYKEQKNDDKIDLYKNDILTNHPNSIYAKIIINPNYKEETENINRVVKQIYEKAFRLYEKMDYAEAMKVINQGLSDYEENDYTDNLALLAVLITGRTEGGDNYKFALSEFVNEYPESELISYAKQLTEAINRVNEREAERKSQQYIKYFDQNHYYILLYESNKALATLLPAEIDAFNATYFPNEKLSTANLIFNQNYSMIFISEFSGKDKAVDYHKKFNSELSPVKDFKSVKFHKFAITKDNFDILYQARQFELYKAFFEQNY